METDALPASERALEAVDSTDDLSIGENGASSDGGELIPQLSDSIVSDKAIENIKALDVKKIRKRNSRLFRNSLGQNTHALMLSTVVDRAPTLFNGNNKYKSSNGSSSALSSSTATAMEADAISEPMHYDMGKDEMLPNSHLRIGSQQPVKRRGRPSKSSMATPPPTSSSLPSSPKQHQQQQQQSQPMTNGELATNGEMEEHGLGRGRRKRSKLVKMSPSKSRASTIDVMTQSPKEVDAQRQEEQQKLQEEARRQQQNVHKVVVASPLAAAAASRKEVVQKQFGHFDGDWTLGNNDYCEACGGAGKLLCCEACPRSFHFECLNPPINEEDIPTDSW